MNANVPLVLDAIPGDLVAFLRSQKRLQYDPETCEAGAVELCTLETLKYERFPVETSGLALFEQDPNYPNTNSYLVLGIDLVASCTGDCEPTGLLLWLPLEKRYGIWDSTHCQIAMFDAAVSWDQIAAAPASYLNAGWTGMDPQSPATTELIPWLAHPYAAAQVYKPQPA